jgi:hypothetical protein
VLITVTGDWMGLAPRIAVASGVNTDGRASAVNNGL